MFVEAGVFFVAGVLRFGAVAGVCGAAAVFAPLGRLLSASDDS